MEEIWKDVVGYEGIYQVSSLGRIKSLPKKIKMRNQFTEKEMILKPLKTKGGYYSIHLANGKGNRKRCQIHRLVAKAFLSNPNNKPQVNHIDGNKKNNCVSNLEWCTAKENNTHALKTGLKELSYRRIPVLQYDLKGNFIKQWESETDTNIPHISDVCKGKRKSAGGYIWRYLIKDIG